MTESECALWAGRGGCGRRGAEVTPLGLPRDGVAGASGEGEEEHPWRLGTPPWACPQSARNQGGFPGA